MRVGKGDFGEPAMIAKQGAQAGGRHGTATVRILEAQENKRGAGSRSFNLKIALKNLNRVFQQRQDPLFVSFSPDAKLALGEEKVFKT